MREDLAVGPKITLIGAGSTVFAKNLLGDILGYEELATSTITLFDIDEERLGTSELVARRVADALGVSGTATIEATAALSQYSATCNPDPVTTIAVFSGTVHVTLQDGQPFDIGPGFELVVFPTPMEQGATFTDDERALFGDQAKLVTPQTPSPTPSPSESPSESPTAPPID